MSEPEQEPQAEPETEPETPDETPDTAPEPEPEAPEAPAAPAMEARDEREVEVIYNKLETRAKNYVKSVGEILEGAGVPVTMCELCADAYPGIRWIEPQDQMHAALVAAVTEISEGAPLKDDPNAQLCAVCDGFGVVKLPSRVNGNQMRTCKSCNGAGFREVNPQSGAMELAAVAPENGEAVVYSGVPLDDPSVVDLRSRGFTVIPPMQPVTEQV
jgi:hypothetical protein